MEPHPPPEVVGQGEVARAGGVGGMAVAWWRQRSPAATLTPFWSMVSPGGAFQLCVVQN